MGAPRLVRKNVPNKKDDVPIFTLTDYGIPELPRRSKPPKVICRIDFVSVFPETPPSKEHAFKSCFNREDTRLHFAESKALTHGFLENGDLSLHAWSTCSTQLISRATSHERPIRMRSRRSDLIHQLIERSIECCAAKLGTISGSKS